MRFSYVKGGTMADTRKVIPDYRYPTLDLYIDGEFRAATGGASSDVIDPATEQCLGVLRHASSDDVAMALEAAARGFPKWRAQPALERARRLRRVADLIRAGGETLAMTITLELGKPWAESLVEVQTAAEMFEWAAEEAVRSYGRVIPPREANGFQYARLEPIGPVAAFSGWNAPAITPSRKISGALAAGCSIVIKPSEETPGVALFIARAVQEAGIPPGVVNMVFGDPASIAAQLIDSPHTKMVTFTGATSVGREIGERAARGMKRATLELGGHAPVLVFDDCDAMQVAQMAVSTKFRNSGQVCTSPTRFYVQRSCYDAFAERFVGLAKGWVVGNGLDPGTRMGPLKNARRLRAIESMVDDARRHGASVLAGGERLDRPGFFYRPTVLADVDPAAQAATTEPFGPLALIQPFDDLEEGLALANALPFGLAAYAFTGSLARANALAEGIESGVVCINEWRVSLPETPFGGVKDSGLGLEGGIEGIREFQRVKCVRTRAA